MWFPDLRCDISKQRLSFFGEQVIGNQVRLENNGFAAGIYDEIKSDGRKGTYLTAIIPKPDKSGHGGQFGGDYNATGGFINNGPVRIFGLNLRCINIAFFIIPPTAQRNRVSSDVIKVSWAAENPPGKKVGSDGRQANIRFMSEGFRGQRSPFEIEIDRYAALTAFE